MNEVTRTGGREIIITDRVLTTVLPALQTYRAISSDVPWPYFHNARHVAEALRLRNERLPKLLQVEQAEIDFKCALSTRRMDWETGTLIISATYRAFGTKSGDNPEAILRAAFSTVLGSDEVGRLTREWEPVRATPFIIAIAIQKIMHNAVFTPKPSELVQACRAVRKKLEKAHKWCGDWLADFRMADALLLEFAPDKWEQPYRLPQYQAALQMILLEHECAQFGDATYKGDFQKCVEREKIIF